MIIIRNEQVEQFEKFTPSREREELLQAFQEFAPLYWQHVPRENVNSFVLEVLQRATAHGLTLRSHVIFFQELCILMGIGFAQDPQYALAIDDLHDAEITDERERVERLWESVDDFLDFTAGENFKHYQAAVDRMQSRAQALQLKPEQFDDNGLVNLLGEIYPEKCEYVGEYALLELVQQARKACADYNLDRELGGPCMTCAMFFLGHACPTDPLFPWIHKVLNDRADLSPQQRTQQLTHRLQRYLNDHLSLSNSPG